VRREVHVPERSVTHARGMFRTNEPRAYEQRGATPLGGCQRKVLVCHSESTLRQCDCFGGALARAAGGS
jgi:hypothetical protein